MAALGGPSIEDVFKSFKNEAKITEFLFTFYMAKLPWAMGRSRQASGQRWRAVFPLRGLDRTPEPVHSFVLTTVLGVRGTVPVLQPRKRRAALWGLADHRQPGRLQGARPEGPACGPHTSVYPCSEGTAHICGDSPGCETLKKPLADKGLTGT